MIPLNDIKQTIVFKVKDKVTPIYYQGIMATLELIHENKDELGLSIFIKMIQSISTLAVPSQQAINHFISEVAFLVYGDDYGWLMLQKLDRVRQKKTKTQV